MLNKLACFNLAAQSFESLWKMKITLGGENHFSGFHKKKNFPKEIL